MENPLPEEDKIPTCSKCQTLGDEGGYEMECGHFYCWECLEVIVDGSSDLNIPCPVTSCDGFFDQKDLPELVGQEVYTAFLQRVKQKKRKLGSDEVPEDEAVVKRARVDELNNNTKGAGDGTGAGAGAVIGAEIATTSTNHRVPTTSHPHPPLIVIPKELPGDDTDDLTTGFGQVTTITKFLITNGFTEQQALDCIAEKSVLSTINQSECAICRDEIDSGDGIIIKNCFHMFCWNCLEAYIDSCTRTEVECPLDCHEVLLPREVRELCSLETYERHYIGESLKAAGDSTGILHCMTPNCTYFCEMVKGHRYKCPLCKQDNCFGCNAQHSGVRCTEYKRKMREEEKRLEALERDKKNLILQRANEKKSIKIISRNISRGILRRCPNYRCQVLVEKNGGCDFMFCRKCHRGFRWSMARVTQKSGPKPKPKL